MFMVIRLVIVSSLLLKLTVSFQTLWDDNRDDRLSKTVYPTPTTTPSPGVDPLFDSSPCYLNTCEDSIIQTIRSGTEFIDSIRCHQLDTQCHCCLRSQLNRSELDKLYRLIGSSLRSRSSWQSLQSSPDKNAYNRICKVLNCDDYQVKAIKSLDDPNSECHTHGNPEESECECCVKSLNKSISFSPSTKHNNQASKTNKNNSSLTRNFISNPFDLESNFFDLFSPSSKSPSSSSQSKSSSYDSSSSNSGSSSSNLFDVDCLHHNCNGPQVKAIKRLSSQVITCIKMGNSDDCKCCFNSSLSIFERVKYEIELTNINNRLQQSSTPSKDSSSYTPLPPLQPPSQPPSLTRRSPFPPSYGPPSTSSSSSSAPSSFFQQDLDCSLHHCKSDLVQLIRSIPTHVIRCSTINNDNYFNDNNIHCRCCIDSSLSNGLNLRNFLRFINF